MSKYNFLNWDFKLSGNLTDKEIDYMISILDSDSEEKEKAYKLYSYCSFKTVTNAQEYYKNLLKNSALTIRHTKNNLPLINAKLDCIVKAYKNYIFEGYCEEFKNPYNCTTLELEKKIKKLVLLNKVLKANINEYIKVNFMFKLFKNSNELRTSYKLLIKHGNNDSRLDVIRDELNNFDTIMNLYSQYEKSEIASVFKYYDGYKGYFANNDYAHFVIEYYINSNKSYDLDAFLNLLGIDKNLFSYSVSTIKELDPVLYQRFLEKEKTNKELINKKNADIIREIIGGIKTGILSDCTPFDALEFIKRIPFKNGGFLCLLKESMSNNITKQDERVIVEYMVKNNLYKTDLFSPFNIRLVYNVKTILNGIEITNDDNDIIFDYLRVNDIPIIKASYLIARDKYLNGEIDTSELEIQKKQKETQIKMQRQMKKTLVVPGAKR